MTTIAYKAGQLAADSLIAYKSITNGFRSKLATYGDYSVALAGTAWLRIPLEEWCRNGCSPERVPPDLQNNEDQFSALIIRNDTGELYEYDSGHLLPIYADYTAIGSGAMLAMGAMAHGATAEEAILAASRHDKNTGGPVTCLSFPLPS